jgi:hypothetical protein
MSDTPKSLEAVAASHLDERRHRHRQRHRHLGTIRAAIHETFPIIPDVNLDLSSPVMLKALLNAGWRPPRAQR